MNSETLLFLTHLKKKLNDVYTFSILELNKKKELEYDKIEKVIFNLNRFYREVSNSINVSSSIAEENVKNLLY